MTPKEALNNIYQLHARTMMFVPMSFTFKSVDTDSLNVIENLVAKATPMKPKVAWKNEEDESVVGYRCLNCNGSLGAKLDDKPMFPNFCRHCGQALDWSDEK